MAGRQGRKGRSQAQERLAGQLAGWFPFRRVRQEVYVGELIESHGYSMDEIARELGHRPHRMFVDVLLSDSEGECAFEYHGEQHYHVVDGMTATERALSLNQHLDREKSWILERIGVPLVAVPYDMYIDEEVIARLMDEAAERVDAAHAALDECEGCGRHFPGEVLAGGLCRRCQREQAAAAKAEFEERRRRGQAIAERDLPADEDPFDGRGDIDGDAAATERIRREDEHKARRKAEAKALRKAAYQEWKASPEAQRRKEEQRAARKAEYQRRKEWLKEQRRKAKGQGDE